VMIAYAVALPQLGFLIATAIASAYLTWRLGTAPLQSLLVGVLTSGGIYVVFRLALGLSLARGPFGF
jgi:putative tricarboxylic transport membrane protein